jgi:hypothetical protein
MRLRAAVRSFFVVINVPLSSFAVRVHRRSAFTAVKLDPDVDSIFVLAQRIPTQSPEEDFAGNQACSEDDERPDNIFCHQISSRSAGETHIANSFIYFDELAKRLSRHCGVKDIEQLQLVEDRTGEVLA